LLLSKPFKYETVCLITTSVSLPYALVLTIVFLKFFIISTQGSKLTFIPSACSSTPLTYPALYETVSSPLASHCAAVAIYVPSLQAPSPPESQLAANNEAIKDEWEKFGLIDYVDYVMGQSQGTKKDCIKYLIDKGYEPKNIVMMGDSPGDILSAKENNVLMYPIIVNEENKSWDLFINHILEKFLKDEYKDAEYIKKYERKLGDLDAKNS
jgi:hypothetical protein